MDDWGRMVWPVDPFERDKWYQKIKSDNIETECIKTGTWNGKFSDFFFLLNLLQNIRNVILYIFHNGREFFSWIVFSFLLHNSSYCCFAICTSKSQVFTWSLFEKNFEFQEDFYAVVDWAYKIDPLRCISMHGITERYLSGQKADAAGFVRLLLGDLESRISMQFGRVSFSFKLRLISAIFTLSFMTITS